MTDTPSPRNWSTKTLARELVRFLKINGLADDKATIGELLDKLRNQIVEDEVGSDLTF